MNMNVAHAQDDVSATNMDTDTDTSLMESESSTLSSSSSSSLSDASTNTNTDVDIDVEVGVGAAGDPQVLTIGVEAVTLPLVTPAANEITYHGRGNGGNVPVIFQVDNGHTYNGQWWASWTGHAAAALVFAANHRATFNLPLAGTTEFRLERRPPNGAAAITYLIRVKYGQLTYGLELEDQAAVRCCHTNVADANCVNVQQTDVLAHTINEPISGLPYLKIELEVNTLDGSLEYVTGPIGIGHQQGVVPNDARDQTKALSLLTEALEYELHNPLGHCGARWWRNARAWITFNHVIDRYNTILQQLAAGFTTPANWVLSSPTQSPKLVGLNANRRFYKYKWKIQCGYQYNAARTNMQVNFILPLKTIGNQKQALTDTRMTHGTHFLDLFPGAAWGNVNRRIIAPYVARSQWVAEQLLSQSVNPSPLRHIPGLVGAGITQLQFEEFRGFLSAWMMTLLHTTQVKCAQAHDVDVAHGRSKNYHANMFKPCLNDIPRYFPNAITDVFVTWWTGAHMAGGTAAARKDALYDSLIALLFQNTGNDVRDGVVTLGACGALDLRPNANINWNPRQHFEVRLKEAIDEHRVQDTFLSKLAWNTRYYGEVDAHQGQIGVRDADRRVRPPQNWECYCGVNMDRTYPPLKDKLYGELSILVEARYKQMPLNIAMMPTHDHTNPTNMAPALDYIRNIAAH